MIEDPFSTRRVVFVDWDNTWLGVMVVPKGIRDLRPFTNFFVGVNMIHPDLRGGMADPWAEERAAKRAGAVASWPRRRVYPEETWYLATAEDGELEIRHSLRYLPGEYVKRNRGPALPFRPGKEADAHG